MTKCFVEFIGWVVTPERGKGIRSVIWIAERNQETEAAELGMSNWYFHEFMIT